MRGSYNFRVKRLTTPYLFYPDHSLLNLYSNIISFHTIFLLTNLFSLKRIPWNILNILHLSLHFISKAYRIRSLQNTYRELNKHAKIWIELVSIGGWTVGLLMGVSNILSQELLSMLKLTKQMEYLFWQNFEEWEQAQFHFEHSLLKLWLNVEGALKAEA